jgi:hypothetical protein
MQYDCALQLCKCMVCMRTSKLFAEVRSNRGLGCEHVCSMHAAHACV